MPMLLPSVEPTAQQTNPVAAPESKNYAPEAALAQGKATENLATLALQVHDNLAEAGAKQNDNELFGALQDMEFKYKQLTNKDAVDAMPVMLEEARDKIRQIQGSISDPLQQGMFEKIANARMQTFSSSVQTYALGNLKAWNIKEDEGRIGRARTAAFNQWTFWKDPNSKQFTDAMSSYEARIREAALNQGVPVDSDTYKQFRVGEMTKLHESVIGTMISNGMSKDAKEYYGTYLNDIDVDKRRGLSEHLKIATTATDADNLAEKVFGEWAQGKDFNSGVPLYELEARVRREAGDNEDVQRAAIAGVKERAASWNDQQKETTAQNVSAVWGLVDKAGGQITRQIQLSPQWLSLTDLERRKIRKDVGEEAATRAARAAANAQRDLANIQRNEHLAFQRNGDKYLTVSDPNVLRQMTRAQVEALRGDFGMDRTLHLLNQWDAIRDPKRYGEVKMDSDDFNSIAISLKLNPYSKREGDRNKVGALKFRIEQAIDVEQRNRAKPMTRQEKLEFTKKEMSKQVLVDSFGPFNTKKPALSLTPKEAKNVMIPKAERVKIAEAMQRQYNRTKDPRYAPTEANLRREYLYSVSPGAAADYQETE